MKVDLYIAWRYLFAKKSHNVINVISAISAAGIAIGTAALILILSVYNGFDKIIENNMSDLDPDYLVTPADDAFIEVDNNIMDLIHGVPGTETVSAVLEKNVVLAYGGRQSVAKAKGVDATYGSNSPIASHLTEGSFSRYEGDVPQASVGAGLAHDLGMHVRFLDMLEVYYPQEGARQSLLGPAASMAGTSLRPGSLFSINSEVDGNLIIMPIEELQRLIGKGDSTCNGLEVRVSSKAGRSFKSKLSQALGEGYTVRDRRELNASLYKMMKYEKLAIYLILIFVVVIVAFNIFGSLSMLIIEKTPDVGTLRAMGASKGLIHRIFLYEGWLISLLGLTAGLAFGVVTALLQQHLGIVKMPGNFLIQAYPVVLQPADVLWTAAGVAAVGFIISSAAARRI